MPESGRKDQRRFDRRHPDRRQEGFLLFHKRANIDPGLLIIVEQGLAADAEDGAAEACRYKPLNNMPHSDLKNAIGQYLHLIDSGMESVHENERNLRIYLDIFALADSQSKLSLEYIDYLGGNSEDEAGLREKICNRFPNYGYYNTPNSISYEIANTEIAVGDAIDDLIDITTELRAIFTLFQENRHEDALRSFAVPLTNII